MRVVSGIENMKAALVLDHGAGEDVQVRLAGATPLQGLAPVFKGHEIARHNLKPGGALAVPRHIAIILQIERVVGAPAVKGNEIGGGAVAGLVESIQVIAR